LICKKIPRLLWGRRGCSSEEEVEKNDNGNGDPDQPHQNTRHRFLLRNYK
jgi:hypothetical protein